MDANHINPFIKSTLNVFETMLNCKVQRTGLTLVETPEAIHEISGIIGLSGKASGSVVVNVSREVALGAYERLLGEPVDQINDEVTDSIGELTNMIAGSAKADLHQYEMSVGIPNVITGVGHMVHFPSKIRPICVHFSSDLGPLALIVGLNILS